MLFRSKNNWSQLALTDYKDQNSLTYGQVAEEIARIHLFFEEIGLKQGDKVSLIGKNHSSWSLVFLATFTYGAVIVPILHEFNSDSVLHIIEHSDSQCAFVNENIWSTLDQDRVAIPTFSIPSFDLLKGKDNSHKNIKQNVDAKFDQRYPNGFTKEDIKYAEVDNEDRKSVV